MVEAVRLRKPALDVKSHSITCTKTVSGSVLTGCLLFSKLISSHDAPAKPVEEDKKREKSCKEQGNHYEKKRPDH